MYCNLIFSGNLVCYYVVKQYIEELKALDLETILIIAYSTFILLFGIYLRRMHIVFSSREDLFLDRLLILGILYAVSPFPLFFLFRHKPKDYGIRFGRFKQWLRETAVFYLIMLLILLVVFKFTGMKYYYPLYRKAANGSNHFLIYQAIQFIHMLGWEFFFRGFMLFSLEKKFGKASILIQTIPFAIMHYRKKPLEAYGSIFAGIFLGILGLRSRSFLPCFLLHFLVALSADILGVVF
jgi:membrane protease YdiL (CAAX protease family)